jgi:hypothetical protein
MISTKYLKFHGEFDDNEFAESINLTLFKTRDINYK